MVSEYGYLIDHVSEVILLMSFEHDSHVVMFIFPRPLCKRFEFEEDFSGFEFENCANAKPVISLICETYNRY